LDLSRGDRRLRGVKKTTLLEEARTPDGRTFTLVEHDGCYTIRVDGSELMSTRRHRSEEVLAEVPCARLAGRPRPCVLIGGLGFGYTLRAALDALPRDASVVVVELMACVIDWNRNPAYRLAAEPLADPRVRVVRDDVAEVLRRELDAWDAVLLDLDNGPATLCVDSNDVLYQPAGLRRLRASLRRGGWAAIWSAGPDAAFERRMVQAGFAVEVHRPRAHGTAGARHTLFLGSAR
jgi:spermidine synthase